MLVLQPNYNIIAVVGLPKKLVLNAFIFIHLITIIELNVKNTY